MAAKAGENNAKGKKRRAQILREAEEVFAEQGYQNASLQLVADRTGLTQSGLLHHFASKEQLLFAVLDEHYKQDSVRLDPAGEGEESLIERMGPMIAHNSVNEVWTRFFSMMAAETLNRAHPANEYMRNRYERVRSSWADEIRADIESGRISRDLDPEVFASLMIAVSDGLQLQWLHDKKIDMRKSFALLRSALEPWLTTT